MDDEDLAEAEESKLLQTAGGFAGLGTTTEDEKRQGAFIDVFRPSGSTMGVKLLQRMGWREGQGIGPKVRRAVREDGLDPNGQDGAEMHLFAPENTRMIGFNKKTDRKGIGFTGETSLSLRSRSKEKAASGDDEEDDTFSIRAKTKPPTTAKRKSGFGFGVLNDTGSDDEVPYEIGPKISYNRVIGGDKKQKGKKDGVVKPVLSSANPMLSKKPVFTPKKRLTQPKASGFRKCEDGRLPLEGFVLAVRSAPPQKTYAPPKIPEGWKSSKTSYTTKAQASDAAYQTTSDAAKASNLNPLARANLLGEQQLPGKSVFDYLSTAARDRVAAASGRQNLPTARNEAPPPGFEKSEAEKARDLRSLLPDLEKDVAAAAFTHRSMPYDDDDAKRGRYRAFLELRAGLRMEIPAKGKDVSTDEYLKEMREFAHAARVFRPVSGMMASRFTSSSGSVLAPDSSEQLLSTPSAAQKEDPAVEAARLGMYGPMTRTVGEFFPTRLLCKRFNVRPPAHVHVGPGGEDGAATSAHSTAEVVGKDKIERMMQDAALSRLGSGFVSGGTEGGSNDHSDDAEQADGKKEEAANWTLPKVAIVDAERNDALEGNRPGDEIFKAIFGSDDEDD